MTTNDDEIVRFVESFAFSLLHQSTKILYFARSNDATIVAREHDDDDKNLCENVAINDVKSEIDLRRSIIDTQMFNLEIINDKINNV